MRYTRLSIEEREEISRYIVKGYNISKIASKLNRHRSTICRELKKNSKVNKEYRAVHAERTTHKRRQKSGRKVKLEVNTRLRDEVITLLNKKWSPEQIANRLKMKYPADNQMKISHESIYRYLYVLPKGTFRKEILKKLRRQQKYRRKRGTLTGKTGRRGIPNMRSIEKRPEEVNGRHVPGHWEGDLIMDRKRNAIGVLNERSTRYTIMVKVNRPTAEEVRLAFAKEFTRLPKELRKTLTYDQGSEMSEHMLFTQETDIDVYFAHAGSPWERGTNENTNGLIRQYFPRGTDLSEISEEEIKFVQAELNDRPRKVLGFLKPIEAFSKLLQ